VTAHQWWWEVAYHSPDFITANEIHIPAGQRVQITLRSEDVIHSFWVPQLAGKTDLIPGHPNVIDLKADDPGTYEGACAEFCGLQHANMRFQVIADAPADFARWQQDQRQDAVPLDSSSDPQLLAGQQAFLNSACVNCHTIRGTSASGTLGPDLTHLASRQRIASGVLPNTLGNLAGWILDPQSVKPGTQMPPQQVDASKFQALLQYLQSLK
jgi:cytochrome c oxidase subunit 2